METPKCYNPIIYTNTSLKKGVCNPWHKYVCVCPFVVVVVVSIKYSVLFCVLGCFGCVKYFFSCKFLSSILSGSDTSNTSLASNICGSGQSPVYRSSQRYVKVTFSTDASNQAVGFEIAYFKASDSCKCSILYFNIYFY